MSSIRGIPDCDHRSPGPPGRLLDARCIELDPVVDGFGDVLVELYAPGGDPGCYEVRQSALASGNRLLVFRTRDGGLARAVFEAGPGVDFAALCAPAAIH